MTTRAATISLSVVVLVLLSAFLLHALTSLIGAHQDYPFDTDEATHSYSALKIARHLESLDLESLQTELYSRSTYPPLAALLRALLFLGFGASTVTARMLSALCLVVSLWLVLLIGLQLDHRSGWFPGLLAALLVVTAVPFWIMGSRAMLEMPGLMMSMLALLLSLLTAARPASWWLPLCTGLAMAAVMVTKYPYGLVVFAAVVLNEVIEAFLRRRGTWRRWTLMAVASVLPMLYWFWQPWKVRGFLHYATMQPHRVELLSLENLLYYPRTLALHYLPSLVMAALALFSLLWACRRWRDTRRRLLLLYFACGLLMLVVKTQNEVRFIATFVPALFLLMGCACTDLWRLLQEQRSPILGHPGTKTVCVLVLMASVAPAWGHLRGVASLLSVTYDTDPELQRATAWIAEQTGGQPFCIIDPSYQLSVAALRWHLATDSTETVYTRPPQITEYRLARQPSTLDLARAICRSRSRSLVVLRQRWSRWPQYEDAVHALLTPIGERRVRYRSLYEHIAHDLSNAARRLESLAGQGWRELDILVYEITIPRRELPVDASWPEPLLGPSLLEPEQDGAGQETVRLDFDRQSARAFLLGGWSGFERAGTGESFVWATGHEASLTLRCNTPRRRILTMRLWPPPYGTERPQQLRGLLNGHVLGTATLQPGPQLISVQTRAEHWRKGENLLVLQLAQVVIPRQRQAGSSDARPLAAAFDWLELGECENGEAPR